MEKPKGPDDSSLEKECITPHKAHEQYKKALVDFFNEKFPDQTFDANKEVFLQTEESGELTLVQHIEQIQRDTGKEFHPEEKSQRYTFHPEDVKKHFEKLDNNVKSAFLEGVKESIEDGEKIVKSLEGSTELSEDEKKDVEEEKLELEANKKLLENLK